MKTLSRMNIMDVVKYLRELARKCHLPDTAGDELAHLRAENALLRATLDGASQAMAAAPIWHTQHRVLGEILSSASRKPTPAPSIKPMPARIRVIHALESTICNAVWVAFAF